MNQTTSPIEIYQFRIILRETSPHLWRRLLANLRLYPKERFGYDEEDADGMSRPWRFQIRLERKLPVEENGLDPRCIGSSGAPAPEDCGGPIASRVFMICFTADYIVHRLAEHVAELHQLRPWMDPTWMRRAINRRLQR
jgi:hypothetical protein